MSLVISKNGKIRDVTLPSQRKIRSTDQQNVRFEDVLKKDQDQNSDQNKQHQQQLKEDHLTDRERKLSNGIKSYQKQEHHPDYQRKHLTARDIGSTPVISIGPDATVGQSLSLMQKYKIHHLIILDRDKALKGIVSDRDLLNRKTSDSIMNFAKSEVILTKENTEIKVLANIMLENEISALPFIDSREAVIGIITKTDLLDYLVHAHPFETYV